MAFVPPARVVCSKKKSAPTVTPAMPMSTRPLARSSATENLMSSGVGPPVGISRFFVETSTVGRTVPAAAAESLLELTSIERFVTAKVKPVMPTSAIELAVAFSAK